MVYKKTEWKYIQSLHTLTEDPNVISAFYKLHGYVKEIWRACSISSHPMVAAERVYYTWSKLVLNLGCIAVLKCNHQIHIEMLTYSYATCFI